MNTQKMLELADFVETIDPEHFNMEYWGSVKGGIVCKDDLQTQCGTTCCIAGWQVVNMGYCLTSMGDVYKTKADHDAARTRVYFSGYFSGYVGTARDVAGIDLGLDYSQQARLFLATEWPKQFLGEPRVSPEGSVIGWDISPQQAAARIRHMVETGK